MQSIFVIMLLALTPFLASGKPSLKSLQESKKEFQAHGLALKMAAKTCIHYATNYNMPLDEMNEDQTRDCVGKLMKLMFQLYEGCSAYIYHEQGYDPSIESLHLCALKTLEEYEPELMDSFSIRGFTNLVDSFIWAFHERFAEKMAEVEENIGKEVMDSVIKELNEMVKECEEEEETADAKFCEVVEKVKDAFAKHSQNAGSGPEAATEVPVEKKSYISSKMISDKELRRLMDLFSKKLN